MTGLSTHHETILEALKDPFANFNRTLIVTPLKRKLIQEALPPGPPIKQVKLLTGPVQKIHLQNVDQTLQELPNLSRTVWLEEVETAGLAMEEQGVSGEVQPVPRTSVSGESGETTSDRGSQSAPEPPKKKSHRARCAPSDIRRKLIQEAQPPGPPIKQVKLPTGPVQKIHLQNVDQTSQELPNLPRTVWSEEVEAAEAAIEEQGVSDEVQPIPRTSVSGESGETTSDRGSQSAPEPPTKKRHHARQAPSDIRRRCTHGQEYRELEVDRAVSSARFFNDYRERY